MTYGYAGKILFVDLSTGEISRRALEDRLYRDFLGGYGLGARIIYERQPFGADPLGPDNILAFLPGLLSGTGAPFSGRFTVAGKSPLTGTWGDANAGGFLGQALKRAGYDGLFVSGMAPSPVWLHVKDGQIEIKDAADLWGLDTKQTDEALRSKAADSQAGIAAIGRAGEMRSLIACIISDGGRAAGRSGLGAVMGSKHLKAVVVEGTGKTALADDSAFNLICARILAVLKPPSFWRRAAFRLLTPFMPRLTGFIAKRGISSMPGVRTMAQIFGDQGTASSVAMSSESGDAPIKNWAGVGYRDFPLLKKAVRISDVNVTKYKTRRYRCGGVCPVGCGGFVTVPKGPYSVTDAHKPEYETLASFGMLTLNDNVEAIIKCNDICNRNGLDTISTGAVVAFAIECYEAGIITTGDTGGLELGWGNAGSVVTLTERIARREGFGAVLADGVARAAEQVGEEAAPFAVHVRGQEPGMHDPKYAPSWATTYATDPTPGRHTAGGAALSERYALPFPVDGVKLPKIERYKYGGKGEVHAAWSGLTQVTNCTGLCMFGGMLRVLPFVDLIAATTGWDYSGDELLKTGERIQTMRQLFNVREGLRPADFKLPGRVTGNPPLEDGPTAGVAVDVATMAAEYFAAMGWDPETGRPSSDRLRDLGLAALVEDEN